MTILLDLWAEDSGRRNSKGLNFWPQPSLSEVGLMGRAAFEDFFFFNSKETRDDSDDARKGSQPLQPCPSLTNLPFHFRS